MFKINIKNWKTLRNISKVDKKSTRSICKTKFLQMFSLFEFIIPTAVYVISTAILKFPYWFPASPPCFLTFPPWSPWIPIPIFRISTQTSAQFIIFKKLFQEKILAQNYCLHHLWCHQEITENYLPYSVSSKESMISEVNANDYKVAEVLLRFFCQREAHLAR